MQYAHLTAFSNEIAGVISLHPKLSWLYPHHPESMLSKLRVSIIDLFALTSVCILSVEAYKRADNMHHAVSQALGALLCAYVIPNLFLESTIRRICPECSPSLKVVAGAMVVFGLYKLEHYTVHALNKFDQKK